MAKLSDVKSGEVFVIKLDPNAEHGHGREVLCARSKADDSFSIIGYSEVTEQHERINVQFFDGYHAEKKANFDEKQFNTEMGQSFGSISKIDNLEVICSSRAKNLVDWIKPWARELSITPEALPISWRRVESVAEMNPCYHEPAVLAANELREELIVELNLDTPEDGFHDGLAHDGGEIECS